MQIRKGTKLKYQYENEKDIFTIIGTRQLRNKYYYIFTDNKNKKQSLSRESILDGIERGVLNVIKR